VKNKDEYTFKIITPTFSYGADNRNYAIPEIRATSIKGMMRYMFRIAQPTQPTNDLKLEAGKLLELEKTVFGDAEKSASPVRLALISNVQSSKIVRQPFLLHNNKKNDDKNKKNGIIPETTFDLRLMIRHNAPKNIDWYADLIKLAFILVGLGQRSRKGRGRAICLDKEDQLMCAKEMKEWIKGQLNQICGKTDFYSLAGNKITPKTYSRARRPMIQKIEFGEVISDWKQFLTKVDDASHKIKLNEKYAHYIYIGGKRKKYFATGSAGKGLGRFASSIMIGLVEINEGLLPIYTYVKPVVGNKELAFRENRDKVESELKAFIGHIRNENKGGGSS